MTLDIHFIHAFTDTLFKGNPAAVILLDDWLEARKMQQIATENNLSETAFAVRDAAHRYQIRWFSPLTEVDFCGHATLATAFVLFQHHRETTTLTFHADAVGELTVERLDDGFMQMSFPNRCPISIAEIPKALSKGLSIAPTEVYRSEQAYFVIYPSYDEVLAVTTDSEALRQLAPYDVVVTALSTEKAEYDFISRYFWPANGADEDPVTGSIHAGLVPLWAAKLAKTQLKAYQASERGGHLYCELQNDRVLVSGQAVRYLKGQVYS